MSDGRAVVSAPSPESVVDVGYCLEIAAEHRIGVPGGEAGICFVTELNDDDGSFNPFGGPWRIVGRRTHSRVELCASIRAAAAVG
mgnify:CR=1 FL=1